MFHQKEGTQGLKSGTGYVSEKIPPKTCCQAVIWSKLKAIFFLVLQTTYPSLWKKINMILNIPNGLIAICINFSTQIHQSHHSKDSRPHKGVLVPAGGAQVCRFDFDWVRPTWSGSLKFWDHILWENLNIFFWRRKNGNLKMGRSWNQSNLWSKGYYQAIYHILIYCTQFLRPGCSSQTKMCKFTPVQNNNHWSKQTLQCAK